MKAKRKLKLPPTSPLVNEAFLNCALAFEMRRYGADFEQTLLLYAHKADKEKDTICANFIVKLANCPKPDLAIDRAISVFFGEL